MKKYTLVSWHSIKDNHKETIHEGGLANTIYCGMYNGEPAVIRIENYKPVFVQFIGNNSIFNASGITLSNVELLIEDENN